MAIRARLAAPAPVEREAHASLSPQWSELPMRLLLSGDRRMEAETYLSSGYGLRLALQERSNGWVPLSQLARVWQPLRLKGTLLPEGIGTPFLAATQVFDVRPVPRKWLAIEKTSNASNRFVKPGTIVVTCSGAVGRATLAYDAHADTLISHDLLRVEPRSPEQRGWIYAYLRSPQARAMMNSAQYGHIIKHLETSHLDALPIPVVRDDIAADFQRQVELILELRNRAHQLMLQAEVRFEDALGEFSADEQSEPGFEVAASTLFSGRRRLEATPHNPVVAKIRKHLVKGGLRLDRLGDAGYKVWLPGRFKRVPAVEGVWFLDSADIFEVNPDVTKRIADGSFGDEFNGRVKDGYLLVARSGQTYGINGSVVLASKALEGCVISDHVLRVSPQHGAKFRAGYLSVVLGHPKLGQPMVKSLAYGSSIPEIDPSDFSNLQIVRLHPKTENLISELAEESAAARSQADILERKIATDAGILVDKFLAGDSQSFVMTTQRRSTEATKAALSALHEHARVRLLRRIGDQPKGSVGAVVHIYGDAQGLEVEFIKAHGLPDVLTVNAKDVDLLND